MIYYIYAYEWLYAMYETTVEEDIPLSVANDIGSKMSESIMRSHAYIMEEVNTEAEKSGCSIDDIIEENKGWRVYKIKDNVPLTLDHLRKEAESIQPELFIEMYCEEA